MRCLLVLRNKFSKAEWRDYWNVEYQSKLTEYRDEDKAVESANWAVAGTGYKFR